MDQIPTSLARHCPDMQILIVLTDIIQLSHPIQIDQYARLNHAEIHRRDKALSARQYFGLTSSSRRRSTLVQWNQEHNTQKEQVS